MGARKSTKKTRLSSSELLARFRRAISPRTSVRPSHFLPSTFCHYTTAAGLEGVVREAKLRATNFSFMNDPSELQYGRDLIQDVVSERLNGAARDEAAFLEYVGINFTSEMLAEVYVCCFTKLEDDLSQWRAYGGTATERYAIGLDSEEIQSLTFRDPAAILAHVRYKPETQSNQ